MHEKTHWLPYISCLIAATLWGLLWYPLRVLEQIGLPGVWATLLIYVFAILSIFPIWLRFEAKFTQPRLLVGIALAAGWTNLAFILALLEGTVARVLILFYLSPVWSMLLAWLILHEQIRAQSIRNLILAISGAVIMLWNGQMQSVLPLNIADLLAITSGIAFAFTNLFVRKSGDMPILCKMVPAWLGVIALSTLTIVIIDAPVPALTLHSIALALAVGAGGIIIMTFTAQYAVTHLPLQRSAVIFLFEVPVGAVSAALISAEQLTGYEYFGGALVMLAAWLTARHY